MARTARGVATLSNRSLERVAIWGLAAVSVTFSVLWSIRLFSVQPPFVDFLPLWTAGRFALGHADHVYDFSAVSQAQVWLLKSVPTPRPFVYPPTALLWLAPLGWLSFWKAAWAWSGIGLGLSLTATWTLSRRRQAVSLLIAVVAPTVVIALFAGQSDLATGGLALLGLEAVPRRPRIAGVLFALAASLKPQVLLLAPVALVAAGAFEVILCAALAFALLAAVSVVAFGLPRWNEWLAALAPFQTVVAHTPGLASFSLSPVEFVRDLGLAESWRQAVGLALAVLAAGIVWFGFRREGACLPARCGLLLGAGVLVSPYALAYDGALLVPPAVVLALSAEELAGITRFGPLVAVTAMALPWTGPCDLLAFIVLMIWAAAGPRAFRRGSDMPSATP